MCIVRYCCLLSLIWRVNYTLKELKVCVPGKVPLTLPVIFFLTCHHSLIWEIFLSCPCTVSNHRWLCLQFLEWFIAETQGLIWNLMIHSKQFRVLWQSKQTWYKKYQDWIQTAAPSTHVIDWLIDWWLMDDWFVGVGCLLLPCESPDKTWVIGLGGKHLREIFLIRGIWKPSTCFLK